MRPRSNDRGNMGNQAEETERRQASMRPPACAVHADRRSNDRGNKRRPYYDAPLGVDASMRPRSNDRGNKATTIRKKTFLVLQ